MKSDELRRAIGGICDEYIENADKTPQKRKTRRILLIAAVISLCAITLLSAGVMKSGMFRRQTPAVTDAVPVTTDKDDPVTSDTGSDTAISAADTDDKPVDDIDVTTVTTAAAPDETKKPESAYTGGTSHPASTSVPVPTTARRNETRLPESTGAPSTASGKPDPTTVTEKPAPFETDPVDTDETKPVETDPVETDPVDPPKPHDGLFADVDVNDWSYKYIEYAVDKGYMTGRTEELFKPDENLTRAEFVYALYTMDGAPDIDGFYANHRYYYDVDEDDWYHPASVWAREMLGFTGKVNDLTNVYFGPDLEINRADVAVILMEYVRYTGCELEESDEIPLFWDLQKAPYYSREAIRALAAAGVLSGRIGDLFDPLDGMTRAETAAILKSLDDHTHKAVNSDLLKEFGLSDMSVGVNLDSSGQHVRVSFKSTESYDWQLLFWPDGFDVNTYPGPQYPMSVEVDIKGADCDMHGIELKRRRYLNTTRDDKYDNPVMEANVPLLQPIFDSNGKIIGYRFGMEPGYAAKFHADEILKVTVRITIGDRNETYVRYPSVTNIR